MKKILIAVALSVVLTGCKELNDPVVDHLKVVEPEIFNHLVDQQTDINRLANYLIILNRLNNGNTIQSEFNALEQKIVDLETRLAKLEKKGS